MTPEQFNQKISAQVLPIAKQLAVTKGFFTYWFKILPRCKTHQCAFDIVNLMYAKIFGEERYRSYLSFHKTKSRYLKNKKL